MWRYRLNKDKIACLYAVDPQQSRRWSFHEWPVRSAINSRKPPPISPSSDKNHKILLPPPELELSPTEDLPAEDPSTELPPTRLRRLSIERLFSEFFRTDGARRPSLRPVRTGQSDESHESTYHTVHRIYGPYSSGRERRNQEEGHDILPRGKSSLFRNRGIQRRISISGEQEARQILGSDFALYSLDSSGRRSHEAISIPRSSRKRVVERFVEEYPSPRDSFGRSPYETRSISRPSMERFVERAPVSRYPLWPDTSRPFYTRDTFKRSGGGTKQFRTYVPLRRWSDGRLNGATLENDVVPGTPITAEPMSDCERNSTGGYDSSDSTEDSTEKKTGGTYLAILVHLFYLGCGPLLPILHDFLCFLLQV